MIRSFPEIKDVCQVKKRNELLLMCGYLLLVLLVLWLEIYALPFVILWLVARWRKDSRFEKIAAILGLVVVYAIVHLFVDSDLEKVDWTIIFIFLALLTPVISRLARKRNA
jgi:di/tricarboxylate transporter